MELCYYQIASKLPNPCSKLGNRELLHISLSLIHPTKMSWNNTVYHEGYPLQKQKFDINIILKTPELVRLHGTIKMIFFLIKKKTPNRMHVSNVGEWHAYTLGHCKHSNLPKHYNHMQQFCLISKPLIIREVHPHRWPSSRDNSTSSIRAHHVTPPPPSHYGIIYECTDIKSHSNNTAILYASCWKSICGTSIFAIRLRFTKVARLVYIISISMSLSKIECGTLTIFGVACCYFKLIT